MFEVTLKAGALGSAQVVIMLRLLRFLDGFILRGWCVCGNLVSFKVRYGLLRSSY